jgi:hypothetical protein
MLAFSLCGMSLLIERFTTTATTCLVTHSAIQSSSDIYGMVLWNITKCLKSDLTHVHVKRIMNETEDVKTSFDTFDMI